MNKIRKLTLLLIVAQIFLSTNLLSGYAAATDIIPVIEEIDLPQDLNFSVSDICSGHAYFMQAAANETGYFAIYSRHIDPDDYAKVDFKKVYIDIYRPDGGFLQELSFTTSLDLAVELKDKTVNIYFYGSVLVYDFTTKEVSHYAIPEGAAVNGSMYKQLRSREFTAGDWVYTCKKGFDGYVKLARSDGSQVQVLVEMPGASDLWGKVILPGGAIGIISMIIIVCQFKRKQCRKQVS